jgi:hypothetical protein
VAILAADGRQIVSRAKSEAPNYEKWELLRLLIPYDVYLQNWKLKLFPPGFTENPCL